MSWFKRILPKITTTAAKKGVPEGIWSKCTECSAVIYRVELERNLNVCPKCEHHMHLSGRARVAIFLDEGDAIELGGDIQPIDRLKFKDTKKYNDRIVAAQKSTNEKEALIVMQGTLLSLPLVAASFDFKFIGNLDK